MHVKVEQRFTLSKNCHIDLAFDVLNLGFFVLIKCCRDRKLGDRVEDLLDDIKNSLHCTKSTTLDKRSAFHKDK